MKTRTLIIAIFVSIAGVLLATNALPATHGSTFTGYAQVVVGPPAPTTIAAVPSLQGYGVVVTWEAPTSPDITGFSIERYRFDNGTWSPATTIIITDPAQRTYLDMCGMGRFAYRVQSIKIE